MRLSILGFITILFLSVGCSNQPGPFEISKQHIGLLTDSTQVKDLETIYAKDSIVKSVSDEAFSGTPDQIDIFEKGGKKLLTLTPKQALDSTSTISSIHVYDERFKTEKGLNAASTFKDIKNNYKISRISNLINSVVVGVDDINAAFTIDKEELPANLRFDRNLKFEATHIPDNAKIKYFFITWNKY